MARRSSQCAFAVAFAAMCGACASRVGSGDVDAARDDGANHFTDTTAAPDSVDTASGRDVQTDTSTEPCGAERQRCCSGAACAGAYVCLAGLCTIDPGRVETHFCNSNAECGAGLTCNLAFPGGLCTMRCTTDRACGANGICAGANGCLLRCRLGADDCRNISGVCLGFDPADATRRGCFPSCYEMPPTGFRRCNMGRSCDPYRGVCENPWPMRMAAHNGAACRVAADCYGGICQTDVNPTTGAPTGYAGGYCLSIARTPPLGDFRAGEPWPQSNCPADTVALPTASSVEGDPAMCVRACRSDADCRVAEGYFCDRTGTAWAPGTIVMSTGACLPINCLDGMHSCPAGRACERVAAAPRPTGVCH